MRADQEAIVDLIYSEARLRTFLLRIRDNSRSGPFARMMATTALEGTADALHAESYWAAQTDGPAAHPDDDDE